MVLIGFSRTLWQERWRIDKKPVEGDYVIHYLSYPGDWPLVCLCLQRLRRFLHLGSSCRPTKDRTWEIRNGISTVSVRLQIYSTGLHFRYTHLMIHGKSLVAAILPIILLRVWKLHELCIPQWRGTAHSLDDPIMTKVKTLPFSTSSNIICRSGLVCQCPRSQSARPRAHLGIATLPLNKDPNRRAMSDPGRNLRSRRLCSGLFAVKGRCESDRFDADNRI